MKKTITLEMDDITASVLDRILTYEVEDQVKWNEEEDGANAKTRAFIISECYSVLEQLEKQMNLKRYIIGEYKERK